MIIVNDLGMAIAQALTGWRLSGNDAYRASVVSIFVNRNHFANDANLGLVSALGLMLEPFLRAMRRGKGGSVRASPRRSPRSSRNTASP